MWCHHSKPMHWRCDDFHAVESPAVLYHVPRSRVRLNLDLHQVGDSMERWNAPGKFSLFHPSSTFIFFLFSLKREELTSEIWNHLSDCVVPWHKQPVWSSVPLDLENPYFASYNRLLGLIIGSFNAGLTQLRKRSLRSTGSLWTWNTRPRYIYRCMENIEKKVSWSRIGYRYYGYNARLRAHL